MKAVAILGGLGSQMMKYAFYLDVKKKSQGEKCYMDTTPFYTMDMWNGYELERIFGIKDADLADFFSEEEKADFRGKAYRFLAMDKMQDLEPGCPVYCTNRGKVIKYGTERDFIVRLKNKLGALIDQYWYGKVLHDDRHVDHYTKDYLYLKGHTYYDEFNHTSDEYFKDARTEIEMAFQFPEFTDIRNREMSEEMMRVESVALHVRRSDHMYDNAELFEGGYFKKSVDLIRAHAQKPVFYVFSEEPEWCKNHLEELGLNVNDEVHFIDWNKGNESYRDMQLMTYCKHNIMVISSFSWWAYYLSKNKEGKIACAPKGYWFDVKNHF